MLPKPSKTIIAKWGPSFQLSRYIGDTFHSNSDIQLPVSIMPRAPIMKKDTLSPTPKVFHSFITVQKSKVCSKTQDSLLTLATCKLRRQIADFQHNVTGYILPI